MNALMLVESDNKKWMKKKKYLELVSELVGLGYEGGEPCLSLTENLQIQPFFNPPYTAVLYYHWLLGIRADVYFKLLDDREFTFSNFPPQNEAEIRPSKIIEFFDRKKASINDMHLCAVDAFEKEGEGFFELSAENFNDIIEDSYFRDKVWQKQKIEIESSIVQSDEQDEVSSIEEISELAGKVLSDYSGLTTTIYLLKKEEVKPGVTRINRVAGAAIGVSDALWPKYEGERMHHAITLDLKSVPKLQHECQENIVAVALFVSDLMDNESYVPLNQESKVIHLTQKDIDQGVNPWIPQSDDDYQVEPCSFEPYEIEVPLEIFDEHIYDRDESDLMFKLFEEISSYSFAGGKPIWIQSAEYDADILFQFDESLVDMNLGDGGCMYVFKDTAFWQCH